MKVWPVILLYFIVVKTGVASENIPLSRSQLESILLDAERYPSDRARDNDRKPKHILLFSRVAAGDVVLDLYAGGGWYTELFSMAVGPLGKVYAHNDSLTWRFGGKEMSQRTKGDRLKNTVRIDNVEISDIEIPDSSVDIVFMGINYHDLFFTSRVRNGVREVMRDKMVNHRLALDNIHRKLSPEGVLIITDHFAKPGSGYDAANRLHRIDPNIVKYQLDQAGFELLEEAFYLRNTDDDLDRIVFDPGIRGKTSRFIYKFGKRPTS